MKKYLFLGSLRSQFHKHLTVLALLLSVVAWGQITEGFETGLRTSGYAGNGTNSGNLTLTSGDWIFVNSGLRSTTHNGGSYGCQMQSGTGNSATLPTLNTCGTISFWFSGGTPTLNKTVAGVTTAITLTKSGNNYSATINDASSSIILKISNSTATSYLDDVVTTAFAASPADHIEFTTIATSAAIGNPATYEVKAMNSSSQVDSGHTGNITLSKVSGPGNVGGTLSKAAVSGVATFSDITFDTAGTYVLKAASSTLGDATTGNIIVTTAVVYNKITSLTDLTDGDYVIVANSTRAMNNDNTTTAGKLGVTAVTVSSNQIINPSTAIVWTIATSGGSKTIFNAASSVYVSGGGANTNLTLSATGSSTSQQWTPSLVSGLFRFINAAQTTRALTLNGTTPFGQYAVSNIDNSTYFDLVLYKKGISGFTVTFNSNGGSGTMANQTASVATNLTTNTFTRTGYTFAGWATTALGTVAYANGASYPFTADATLYAVWTPNNNTITFDKNAADATGTMANQTIATAATANLSNNAFSRVGYAFSGWATTAGGTVAYADGASYIMGTSNVTLYAVWSTLAPYITTSGTLSDVSTVYGTASATPASFTVSAGNLTNNLIITPPSGFEVSLTSGGIYTTSVNLGTTITPNTPVYIRLAATTAFGTYSGNINLASGATTNTIATVASNVSKKTLTITGLTGSNKIYDGTTAASVSGTPAYSGLVNGETFSVTGTVTFSFINANVGTGKTINKTGSYDAPSVNYTVTQPTITADITAKELNITAPSIASRVYSPGVLTTGTISVGTLSGFVGTETVTATATGNYANADAGTGKTATVTYVLANGTNGGLAANYSLAQGSGTGNITKATPVYSSTTISVSVGGNQTITSGISDSPGVLTFSSLNTGIATVGTTTGTVTGVAVGSTTVNVTQAEDTNYIAGSTTVPVTVSTVVYNSGDFRSTTDGNWHSTQASNTATWQTYNGSTWVASATAPPVNAAGLGTKTVYIRNTIMLVGNNTAPNVTIESGGVLNTSTVTATFGNLLVRSGGIFNRQGNGSGVSGNFEVEDNATVNFYHTNTTSRSTTIWAGTEKFHANSNFVIKTTDSGSNFLVIQSNNDVSEYNGACFGNLIVDLGTGTLQLLPAGFNKVLANNLIFRTTTGNVRLSDSTYSFGILNNIEIENTYGNTLTALTTAGTSTITVGGNLIYNGSSILRLANNATAAVTLNINGDILLNSGTLDLNAVSGGSGTVNLKGDLTVGSSASFIAGNGTTATFNFAGTGDGLTDATTQAVNVINAATSSNIAFNVNSGAYVKLINQNFALGTNSSFTVKTGGTLDFGYNGSAALNLARVSGNLGQSFNAATGSTLKITSPDGLSNGASVYTGNVQVGATTAARIFSPSATYHFTGKVNQSTGNGLPSPLTGKVIVELDTQNATQDDLEFRSSGNTNFGTVSAVNGILEIKKGKVIDEPNNGFRNYNGAADDGENDIQRGDVTMSGGRYVVSGAGTKPSLSGNYTLTGGNIEFTGSAATKIRIKPSYYNVDISGSNVEAGGKNFIINNLLKVTDAAAVLTIPEVILDSETPYVVTAKKGLQVATGGKVLFKNNANLMQDKDAANSGNITMERKANVPSTQYNYWTSPVKNQVLYSLYQGIPNNTVMVYNSANDKFTILTTASATVSQFGKGYSIKGSSTLGAAVTASFVGEPNNETTAGVNSIPLSTAGSNYNLVGNPYPSNLNLVALYNGNSTKFYNGADETPTAYLWDNTSNTNLTQLGTGYVNQNYAMVNLSSGIGLPAPRVASTGKQPNGIVRPGQGFIIRAAETGGSLVFNNATMRTSNIAMGGTNSQYYKDSENGDKFYLKLTTANDMHLMIAVAYYPEAENSFERFDSAVFSEAVTENFYSLSSDSKKLAIQGRKGNFSMDDVIPLGIKTSAAGNQKITIESKDGVFSESQNIYLKDKLLNKTINLTTGDYTFQAVKGTDLTRFEIVYKEDTVLGTDAATKSDFITYRDGNNIVIKSSKILGKIEVLDVSGRLLKTFTTNQTTSKIDMSVFSNGIYILKVENSGDVRTKKINK